MFPFQLSSQAALARAWRNLTHAAPFTRHSVWLMLIDDEDRAFRPVVELEDAVEPPDEPGLRLVVDFLADLVAAVGHGGVRLAALRSRPGGGPPLEADLDWARALRAAARHAGLECEAVHFASDDHLVVVPPEEQSLSA